ncbi:MAG: arsenate reductase ArsC [Acidobacteriota bacterium]
MNDKPGLLVLCTGNSARSQMAASFFRHYAGDRFHVLSADTEPAERVHPLTVEVMREKGVDLSTTEPVDYRDIEDGAVQILVIVCDGASKSCPAAFLGDDTERLLWPFDDPAALEGSTEEKLTGFRRIRDEIEPKIRDWAA